MSTRRGVASFRLSRTFGLFAMCCFACLLATPAPGDGLVQLPPTYDVTGTLQVVGNDVCSDLPCTENISLSFDFGYFFVPAGTFGPGQTPFYLAYYSSFQANGSGALGSFTVSVPGPGTFGAGAGNFLAFDDASGDEIDIFSSVSSVAAPVAPSFGGPDLEVCETKTCVTDFSAEPNANPPVFGHVAGGTGAFTVTPAATPEPSILSLLAFGLFALGLAGASKKCLMFKRSLRPDPLGRCVTPSAPPWTTFKHPLPLLSL